MAKTNKKTIKVVYNNKGQLDIKEVESKKFDTLHDKLDLEFNHKYELEILL